MYPETYKYTTDHEGIDLGSGRVGITDYAQKQLGDVVFVELPEVGRKVKQGESFGTIESVKAVSELFSPMSGEILEVNNGLADHPEKVNSEPHQTWMIRLRIDNPSEAGNLLDSSKYDDFVK